MKIDVDAVQARLNDPANAPIAQSLREIGITSAVDLFGTYAGDTTDMANWLKDAQINTDRNLRLQFLAGLGLNLYQSDPIYKKMIVDTKYPDALFEGTPETLAALRQRIDANLALSRPPRLE
jgi:spermidine synthase